MGRPTIYREDLAAAICGGIIAGESLQSILAAEAMPSRSTVFRWLGQSKAFRTRYVEARSRQTEFMQQRVRRAQAAIPDLPEDAREFKRAKKRLQDMKRIAGQLAPKRYRPSTADQ